MAVSSKKYRKITISNEGILDENFKIDKGMLAYLDKHYNMFDKAIQSATNYKAYVSDFYKKIDKKRGIAEKSWIVAESDYKNVMAAISRVNESIFPKVGDNPDPRYYKIDSVKAWLFNFKKTLLGKRSRNLAEEIITDKLGGVFGYASAKDEENEKVTLGMFTTEDEITKAGGFRERAKQLRNIINYQTRKSTEYSHLERDNRQAEEEEKKKREEEKRLKEEQKEKERKDKQEKRDKEKIDRLDKATNREAQKKNLLFFSLVVTLLTSVVNITRKILSSALQRAKEVKEISQNAVRMNVHPNILQKYLRMERAIGLPEGSTSSAIGSVITSFGQIDKEPDSSIIATLAPVLREDTVKAIEVGLAKTNPEDVAKMIIDDFYQLGLEGKDWRKGDVIGRNKAFLNLINRLKDFSPDMANILSTMFYLNRSEGYSGKINKFDDLLGLKGEQSVWSIDRKVLENLEIELEGLTAKFKTLRENVLGRFSTGLSELVDKMNNLEIFMSPEDIEEKRIRNTKLNREALSDTNSRISTNIDLAKDYINSEGIDIKALGYDNVEDFLNNADIEKIKPSALPLHQRRELAILLATQKVLKENKTKIEESLADRKKPYYRTRYESASIAERIKSELFYTTLVSDDELPENTLDIVLGNDNVWRTYLATGAIQNIVKLAKSRGGKNKFLESDKDFIKRMIKEGYLSIGDIARFNSPDIMYGSEEEDIVLEKYKLAKDKFQNTSVELFYLREAFRKALKENYSRISGYLKNDSEIEVTGSRYNPKDQTITFVLDVNGEKREIGVFDTSAGDFRHTGGNIGSGKVIITNKDLRNAMGL